MNKAAAGPWQCPKKKEQFGSRVGHSIFFVQKEKLAGKNEVFPTRDFCLKVARRHLEPSDTPRGVSSQRKRRNEFRSFEFFSCNLSLGRCSV